MQKKTVSNLIMICCFLISKANAQQGIGFVGSVSYNHLSYHDSNKSVKLANALGLGYNLIYFRKFNNLLNLEICPGLVQKNYSLINTAGIYQKTDNDYLQMPVSLVLNKTIFKKIYMGLSLGLYAAYWLSSNVEGQVPNIFDTQTTSDGTEIIQLDNVRSTVALNNTTDNRFEYGLSVKASIGYGLSQKLNLTSGVQLLQSLTDQQKITAINQFSKINRTLLLDVGISYNFTYKKSL
jgi:hypothetical protein